MAVWRGRSAVGEVITGEAGYIIYRYCWKVGMGSNNWRWGGRYGKGDINCCWGRYWKEGIKKDLWVR